MSNSKEKISIDSILNANSIINDIIKQYAGYVDVHPEYDDEPIRELRVVTVAELHKWESAFFPECVRDLHQPGRGRRIIIKSGVAGQLTIRFQYKFKRYLTPLEITKSKTAQERPEHNFLLEFFISIKDLKESDIPEDNILTVIFKAKGDEFRHDVNKWVNDTDLIQDKWKSDYLI